jgi:hypothetical protein
MSRQGSVGRLWVVLVMAQFVGLHHLMNRESGLLEGRRRERTIFNVADEHSLLSDMSSEACCI